MSEQLGPYHVRKSRWGDSFEVIEIVKETARTYSYRDQDLRGDWSRRAWLDRSAAPTKNRFHDLEVALQAAEAGTLSWRSQQKLVDDAGEAHRAAQRRQRASAEAVVSSFSS